MHVSRASAAALRVARRGLATKTTTDSLAVPGEFDRLHNLLPYKPSGRNGSNGIVATIFGSTGFLGRFVVPDLAIQGTQCILPFRGDGNKVRPLKLGGDLGQCIPLPCDLYDEATVRRAVEQSNVVINLIGNDFNTRLYNLHDSNVKTAYRIAKFAAEAGVQRFVQVSANIADPNSKSEWARHKYEAEEVVKGFFPDAIIMRTADVYGDGDKFIHKFSRIIHFTGRNFTSLEMAKTPTAPIWAGDVSRAIAVALVDADAPGSTYELAGQDVFTWESFLETIRKYTYNKSEIPSVKLPEILLKPLAAVLEQSPAYYKILSQDMLTRYAISNLPRRGAKGLKELGLTATPFDQEGARLLAYFDQNKGPKGFSYIDQDPHKMTDEEFAAAGLPRRYRIKIPYGPRKEQSRL